MLLGQAGGGFAAKTDFATGDGPESVAVGDFNGDSDPDLTVANVSADSVSVLINTSRPVVSLSPGSLSFPATPVGQVSARQDVTVKNTGEGSLEVSAAALAAATRTSSRSAVRTASARACARAATASSACGSSRSRAGRPAPRCG